MSTRCQVIIKDKQNELWFYRHSDGYPEGVERTLNMFKEMVKAGKIRKNVEQASGWLVLIGAVEYQKLQPNMFCHWDKPSYMRGREGVNHALEQFKTISDWKCGSYEPSVPHCQGDIEHLYLIELEEPEVYEIELVRCEDLYGPPVPVYTKRTKLEYVLK